MSFKPPYQTTWFHLCQSSRRAKNHSQCFENLQHKYRDWVLDVLEYDSIDNLIHVLEDTVVKRALTCSERLVLRRIESIRKTHVSEFEKLPTKKLNQR